MFFFIICIGNDTFGQSFNLTSEHRFEIEGNYSIVDSVLVGCYSDTGWKFQFQPLDIPFSITNQTSCNYLTFLVPEKQPIIIKKESLSIISQFSCVDNLNAICSLSIQSNDQIIKFHPNAVYPKTVEFYVLNDLNNPLYPIDTLLPIVEFSQTIFNEYNRLHRSGLSIAGSTTSVIDINDSSDFTNLNSWSLSGFRSDIFQPSAFINLTLQSLLSSPSLSTRIIFTNSADLVAKSSNHQNHFIILGTTINEFSMTHELFHMCEQCNTSQKICHMNELIDWTNIMHTQTQYPRCEILLNQILSNFDFGINGAIEDSNFSHLLLNGCINPNVMKWWDWLLFITLGQETCDDQSQFKNAITILVEDNDLRVQMLKDFKSILYNEYPDRLLQVHSQLLEKLNEEDRAKVTYALNQNYKKQLKTNISGIIKNLYKVAHDTNKEKMIIKSIQKTLKN